MEFQQSTSGGKNNSKLLSVIFFIKHKYLGPRNCLEELLWEFLSFENIILSFLDSWEIEMNSLPVTFIYLSISHLPFILPFFFSP